MLKKTLIAVILIGQMLGCAKFQDADKIVAQPPVIIDFYAAKVMRTGAVWRIFVWARDPDGDMKHFVCLLYQPGYGYHDTEFVKIKEPERAEVVGYLTVSIPQDDSLLGNTFNMKLAVVDMEGNNSKIIDLPVTFDFVSTEKLPPKWEVFSDNLLGVLLIDITSPQRFKPSTN